MLKITAKRRTKNGCTDAIALTRVTKPIEDARVNSKTANKFNDSLNPIIKTTLMPFSLTVDIKCLKFEYKKGINAINTPILR